MLQAHVGSSNLWNFMTATSFLFHAALTESWSTCSHVPMFPCSTSTVIHNISHYFTSEAVATRKQNPYLQTANGVMFLTLHI